MIAKEGSRYRVLSLTRRKEDLFTKTRRSLHESFDEGQEEARIEAITREINFYQYKVQNLETHLERVSQATAETAQRFQELQELAQQLETGVAKKTEQKNSQKHQQLQRALKQAEFLLEAAQKTTAQQIKAREKDLKELHGRERQLQLSVETKTKEAEQLTQPERLVTEIHPKTPKKLKLRQPQRIDNESPAFLDSIYEFSRDSLPTFTRPQFRSE